RLLAAFVELVAAHPDVAAVVTAAAITSAAFGAAIALLVRGGVLARLAGPSAGGAWAEFGRACLGHLPVLALIALYGLLLRLALTFVAHALAGSNILAELIALALLLTFATCT